MKMISQTISGVLSKALLSVSVAMCFSVGAYADSSGISQADRQYASTSGIVTGQIDKRVTEGVKVDYRVLHKEAKAVGDVRLLGEFVSLQHVWSKGITDNAKTLNPFGNEV
ncbi:hypothetical protein MK079_03655, partial [Candidatus Gracilibacteria bacterium]|nr:hypothetical protein [Candidatus Gracilibacteria bacterium]